MDNQLQNKPWHERLEAHAVALQLMSATGNEELFYRGLKTLLSEVHAFHADVSASERSTFERVLTTYALDEAESTDADVIRKSRERVMALYDARVSMNQGAAQ
ncbi:MAG: hypothetical protein PW999_09715 [Paraburkholderia tropica]|nr:hypothetical protein [Paraburkholderia tropica]